MAAKRKKVKKESPALPDGLTPIEMKLLKLALDKGAYEGEADTAAVMFIRKLRERSVKAEDLFKPSAETKYGSEKMTFGKYRDKMIKDVPLSYLCWVLDNCVNISSSLRLAIRNFLTAE
jgi:hypothetical protein